MRERIVMNNTPEDFYSVGDKDFITTTSIDEAVQDWYDSGHEFQEEVEVCCWTKGCH